MILERRPKGGEIFLGFRKTNKKTLPGVIAKTEILWACSMFSSLLSHSILVATMFIQLSTLSPNRSRTVTLERLLGIMS